MTRRRHTAAFTLIEMIAAIVLLSLGVPPILWALRQAQQDRVAPVQLSRARWLAVQRLEQVVADRHSTSRGYAYLISSNYPSEPAVPGFDAFSRQVTIDETGGDLVGAGAGFKTVTITIGWTDIDGIARQLAISTVVTEYPSP